MSHFGRSGDSRGFAFVRYKYADEAQKAVERLDGRVVDGREITVQFAKYGPNAERIQKGRIIETSPKPRDMSRSRSPRRRDRDYRKRSRSRSVDRNDRDKHRGRDRDHRRRSRSRSASPDHSRGRGRGRYDDELLNNRSMGSASPPWRSASSRRSLSPRKVSPSKGDSPDRHHDVKSPPPRSASPVSHPAVSRNPSH